MKLLIDIGNSRIHCCLASDHGFKVLKRVHVGQPGQKCLSRRNAVDLVKKAAGRHIAGIKTCALCSVVPKQVGAIRLALRDLLGLDPVVVGTDTPCGIRFGYDNPRELGPDRIANLIGLSRCYGLPAIVVDVGTAVTFDVMKRNMQHYSAGIFPGPGVSSRALAANTVLLNEVSFFPMKDFVARNTKESLQVGLFYGYSGLVESMIERISRRFRMPLTVVLTGGASKPLVQHLDIPKNTDLVWDPDLTFKGLYFSSVQRGA